MEKEFQHYELTLIIPGSISEDQHPEIINRLQGYLANCQAQNTTSEEIGRRKLAYPINHQRHGFYLTFKFDFQKDQAKNLEQNLKLDQAVLRYLLIKKTPRSAEEVAKQEKLKTQRIKKKIAEQIKTEKEEDDKEKISKKKISLEDLDKKLDELLDDQILK